MKSVKLLSSFALATAMSTSPVFAQKSTSAMTQQEIHDRALELCNDPLVINHLRNPDELCEISTDNGKTWKEYIPGFPDGTGKTVGGLVGLLALLAGGIAIMRYRKKEEYSINPDLAKKSTSNIEPKDKGKKEAFDNSKAMLAQAMGAIPDFKGLRDAMNQNIPVDQVQVTFPRIEKPVEIVDIPVDQEEGPETLPLLQETIAIVNVTSNNDKGDITPELEIKTTGTNEINVVSIIDSTDIVGNTISKDVILEKLQGGILDTKAIEKLNVSLPKGKSYKRIFLPQKNRTGRYGFNISEDEEGMIKIIKDHKIGYIYFVESNKNIQESEEYSLSGVKAVQVIENGYLEFIVGENFERKVILLSKEKISLS